MSISLIHSACQMTNAAKVSAEMQRGDDKKILVSFSFEIKALMSTSLTIRDIIRRVTDVVPPECRVVLEADQPLHAPPTFRIQCSESQLVARACTAVDASLNGSHVQEPLRHAANGACSESKENKARGSDDKAAAPPKSSSSLHPSAALKRARADPSVGQRKSLKSTTLASPHEVLDAPESPQAAASATDGNSKLASRVAFLSRVGARIKVKARRAIAHAPARVSASAAHPTTARRWGKAGRHYGPLAANSIAASSSSSPLTLSAVSSVVVPESASAAPDAPEGALFVQRDNGERCFRRTCFANTESCACRRKQGRAASAPTV